MNPLIPYGSAQSRSRARSSGFTLVELLVVVGVIVLLTGLAIPAFNAIRGGTDFTSEVYNITGMLDQARAYAMANNTYVLAGITEVSANQDTGACPQVSGTGRIAIAIVASKTGMRPYQSLLPNNLATWPASLYASGTAFIPVGTVMTFPNLHMVDLQYNGNSALSLPASGNMARPALGAYGYYYDLPNVSGSSSTQFAWPLGTSIAFPPVSPTKYAFSKVIEYDPQGSARIISASNSASYPDAVPLYIEIGLEPSAGGVVASQPSNQNTGQLAAIQINGISGAAHIYRP